MCFFLSQEKGSFYTQCSLSDRKCISNVAFEEEEIDRVQKTKSINAKCILRLKTCTVRHVSSNTMLYSASTCM